MCSRENCWRGETRPRTGYKISNNTHYTNFKYYTHTHTLCRTKPLQWRISDVYITFVLWARVCQFFALVEPLKVPYQKVPITENVPCSKNPWAGGLTGVFYQEPLRCFDQSSWWDSYREKKTEILPSQINGYHEILKTWAHTAPVPQQGLMDPELFFFLLTLQSQIPKDKLLLISISPSSCFSVVQNIT